MAQGRCANVQMFRTFITTVELTFNWLCADVARSFNRVIQTWLCSKLMLMKTRSGVLSLPLGYYSIAWEWQIIKSLASVCDVSGLSYSCNCNILSMNFDETLHHSSEPVHTAAVNDVTQSYTCEWRHRVKIRLLISRFSQFFTPIMHF